MGGIGMKLTSLLLLVSNFFPSHPQKTRSNVICTKFFKADYVNDFVSSFLPSSYECDEVDRLLNSGRGAGKSFSSIYTAIKQAGQNTENTSISDGHSEPQLSVSADNGISNVSTENAPTQDQRKGNEQVVSQLILLVRSPIHCPA
ncbi:hypothetical protein BDV06DRAFT_206714 [Aspergillus oleicola]